MDADAQIASVPFGNTGDQVGTTGQRTQDVINMPLSFLGEGLAALTPYFLVTLRATRRLC